MVLKTPGLLSEPLLMPLVLPLSTLTAALVSICYFVHALGLFLIFLCSVHYPRLQCICSPRLRSQKEQLHW